MSKLIKRVGTIVLDTPLIWEGFDSSRAFLEEVKDTIDGSFLVYRMPKVHEQITLLPDGYQKKSTKDSILALSRLNASTTLTDYDNVTYGVDFDHTQGAVVCEPVAIARLADRWAITIHLRTA